MGVIRDANLTAFRYRPIECISLEIHGEIHVTHLCSVYTCDIEVPLAGIRIQFHGKLILQYFNKIVRI
jgi:hypothetical protein